MEEGQGGCSYPMERGKADWTITRVSGFDHRHLWSHRGTTQVPCSSSVEVPLTGTESQVTLKTCHMRIFATVTLLGSADPSLHCQFSALLVEHTMVSVWGPSAATALCLGLPRQGHHWTPLLETCSQAQRIGIRLPLLPTCLG